MSDANALPASTRQEVSREEHDDDVPKIGDWLWVNRTEEDDDGNPVAKRWFACVTEVGSNYVYVENPGGRGERIHFDRLAANTTPEPNWRGVIRDRCEATKAEVAGYLAEVKETMARLGVASYGDVTKGEGGSDTTALARLSDVPDPKDYKVALEKAKKDELPALFKKMKDANERLVEWMSAEVLPLQGLAEKAKETVKVVEDRIFNVELYAGLTEEMKHVRKGEPARADEKLHVMQRRLYMDEECLLDYRHGGMDIKKIGEFDRWVAKKKNFERILPFPRCLVAMQVRRKEKKRWSSSLGQAWINFNLAQDDKLTFLYVRNGDHLYRMNCALEFGDLIFPPKEELTAEPQMVKVEWGKVEAFRTVREHETLLAAEEERKKKEEEWKKANPFKKWKAEVWDPKHPDGSTTFIKHDYERANPYYRYYFDEPFRNWHPFDKSSVYYDEAMAEINDRIKQWNRIAIIIQGLFDRSEVLHPHPPVRSWTPEGFAQAIELVYDGSNLLAPGPRPDFFGYVAKCLTSIDKDSVTIGQQRAWWKRIYAEECAFRANNRRYNDHDPGEYWTPDWDHGPGFLAKIARLDKRGASYRWLRKRRNHSWRSDEQNVKDSITLPLVPPTGDPETTFLFNVSAYRPGDFLQFFEDPRTRADYLQWAPLLLTAEEFHAGNVKPQEPGW